MAVSITGSVQQINTQVVDSSASITVPSDAEAIIVSVAGWIANETSSFLSELNFDDGATLDFSLIGEGHYTGTVAAIVSQHWIITNASADWPGTGSKTLYWLSTDTIYEGYVFGVYYVKGLDTDSPIVDTDTTIARSTNWTSGLTGVGADDLGVAALYQYAGTSGEVNTDGQTEILDSGVYRYAALKLGYEAGEDALVFTSNSGDITPFAFALKAAAAQATTITDDFNRASLGSNWNNDKGNSSIVSNSLRLSHPSTYNNVRVRWVNSTLAGTAQYAKTKLSAFSSSSGGFGFILRGKATDSEHYQVHIVISSAEVKWERYNPEYVERYDTGDLGGGMTIGQWFGALVEGTGSSTTVKVWRWASDPDSGGAVDVDANWGTPGDTLTTGAITDYVDSGAYVGLRAYTGSGPVTVDVDDFAAGAYGAGPVAASFPHRRLACKGALNQM